MPTPPAHNAQPGPTATAQEPLSAKTALRAPHALMATSTPDAAGATLAAVLDAQIEFIQQILCPAPLRPHSDK